MNSIASGARYVAGIFGWMMALGLAQAQAVREGVVSDTYAQLCASCHGARLEGGKAPSMLDDVWTYGGDDESLSRSIRLGYPDKGMPAWSAALPEAQIRAMVVFIRERRAEFVRAGRKFEQPKDGITAHSERHDFRVDTWVAGLSDPWSMVFLPDGSAVVSERGGHVYRLTAGGRRVARTELKGFPRPHFGGESGFFGLVAHPDFERNRWLYLAYADPTPDPGRPGLNLTKVVRGHLIDNAWVDAETIFAAPAFYTESVEHYGGRLAFDREGFLYFSIGERKVAANAQDLKSPCGKIHRVHDDGRVPADNPFVGVAGADPTVWSYGHRNPQGLAFDPVSGQLYSSEHGPRGGDELNLILKGRNYGWPEITHGMDYDGTTITPFTAKPGMEQPVIYWTPSIAPCGLHFYTGDQFPRWRHQLFVASLIAEELRRIEWVDGRVAQEVIFKGLGRIRDVVTGPDGALYVLLEQRIVRLTPVKLPDGG